MESKYSGKFYLRKRYLVTFLAFSGWIFLYLMRTNLSISIVDMTSNKSVTVGNETFIKLAEYDWSSKQKGVILSAFSWGYSTAPLSVVFVRKYEGVRMFGTGVLLTALLTFITPFILSWNLYAFLVARFFEGVFESMSCIAFIESLRIWSLPWDRSRLTAGATSGGVCGSLLGFPICGTIAYYMDWKRVFYSTGGVSILWAIVWFSVVKNSPEEDNMMTLREKNCFRQFNPYTSKEKKLPVPWKQIFKSKAVWAFWNNRFMQAWTLGFLGYCFPIYVKDIHDVSVKEVGFLSGLPHFSALIAMIGGSVLADVLRNRGLFSVTNVHQLYLSFTQFAGIALLITAALWRDFVVNIICICLFTIFFYVCVVSYEVLPIDVAGEHACIIAGGGTMLMALGIGLSTVTMGLIVTHHSYAEWTIYLLILSSLNLWGGLLFWKFGTGEFQPWATLETEKTEEQIKQ